MSAAYEVFIRKLREHSPLGEADLAAIRALPATERMLAPGEDTARQGDKPKASAIVLRGRVARYHTLPNGGRQYLSLHIPGDMPDSQTLFIEVLDHGVCAMEQTLVALVPHPSLQRLLETNPTVAIAIWRETLIDAAIFRQAITNNSARPLPARLAHFFCEQYYRARAGGHARPGACRLPLTQTQLGEMLGASLPSISRTLQALRATKAVDLQGGELRINDWSRLVALAGFDPGYLHLTKPRRL